MYMSVGLQCVCKTKPCAFVYKSPAWKFNALFYIKLATICLYKKTYILYMEALSLNVTKINQITVGKHVRGSPQKTDSCTGYI